LPEKGIPLRTALLLVPEQQDQNNDRNWNSDQPQQYTFAHVSLLNLVEANAYIIIEFPPL
jgi:hypothetical protein